MIDSAVARAVRAVGGSMRASTACGVSYWTVRNWLTSTYIPHGRPAVLLARAAHDAGYDVSVDELVGLERPNGCASASRRRRHDKP